MDFTWDEEWYRSTGRAFPDVAAAADDVPVFGAIYGAADYLGIRIIGGTSCAAPMFAGIVALLNDALAQEGKPPLGFLNPLLYKMKQESPATLHDVTHGVPKTFANHIVIWE